MFTCNFEFKCQKRVKANVERLLFRGPFTEITSCPRSFTGELNCNMGSEISAEEINDHQNGDVKKDDDLQGNVTERANENDKDSKTAQEERQTNGEVRNRKTGRAGNRTKAELRKSILKTKPPSKKEQHTSVASKWLSSVCAGLNGKSRTSVMVKLLIFLAVLGLAFATRFFNVTLPAHIWLV